MTGAPRKPVLCNWHTRAAIPNQSAVKSLSLDNGVDLSRRLEVSSLQVEGDSEIETRAGENLQPIAPRVA